MLFLILTKITAYFSEFQGRKTFQTPGRGAFLVFPLKVFHLKLLVRERESGEREYEKTGKWTHCRSSLETVTKF